MTLHAPMFGERWRELRGGEAQSGEWRGSVLFVCTQGSKNTRQEAGNCENISLMRGEVNLLRVGVTEVEVKSRQRRRNKLI